MSFAGYPAYRESGVEWLGLVPVGWEVVPLKRAASVFPSNVDKKSYDDGFPVRLCNYTDVYYHDCITNRMELMEATASPEQIEKFTLRSGDTVITKDSETADDIGIGAYVPVDLPGIVCGYHLSIIRPLQGTCGAFVKRLFDSHYVRGRLEVCANGLTRVGLSQYSLDNLNIPVPVYSEQTAIAAFLDRETAKIDGLIGEQERLVELLREKRQAVISHAVTKGLDPSVPMKDSGVEWLGLVPAHWEVKRLKRIATVQGGVAKGKDLAGQRTVTVPYLRVANVQDGYLKLETIATMEIPEGELDRYLLQPGDVLMNEGGDFDKLGRGYIWRGEIDPCSHQNHVFAVRPKSVGSEWLNAVTGSDYAQFYFMTRSKQSTNLASISSTNLMELPVVLPPVGEQNEILRFIEVQKVQFDALTAEAETAIRLLRERRTALISAAVTGKIDVRGIVAG